jgi:hypothetical protein
MFFIEALGAGPRVRERRDLAIEQVTDVLAASLTPLRRSQDAGLPAVSHELARAQGRMPQRGITSPNAGGEAPGWM